MQKATQVAFLLLSATKRRPVRVFTDARFASRARTRVRVFTSLSREEAPLASGLPEERASLSQASLRQNPPLLTPTCKS